VLAISAVFKLVTELQMVPQTRKKPACTSYETPREAITWTHRLESLFYLVAELVSP
jgi:hypothetical protein